MRKIIALAVFCSLVTIAALITSCKDKAGSTPATNEDSLKQAVARGEYLATYVAGCIDCHSKRDINKFSAPVIPGTEGQGGFLFDEHLGLPGKLYAKNITPDSATGIGAWTDAELIRALTQGISRNGDTLFPLMPYPHFNHVTRADLMDIIAYIRTLKPSSNAVPARQLMIPIGMAYPAAYLQPSIDSNMKPDPSDKVKYGEYLVNMADCGTCHSPLTEQGPDMTRQFSGGYTFDLGTFKVTSANITPDSATGIGTWTEEAFLAKFRNNSSKENVERNPGKENTVMPWYFFGKMKEDDLRAIYAYLRTVPAMSHKVEKYPR